MSDVEVPAGPAPVMRVARTLESLGDAYAAILQPAVRSARASRAAVFTMGALHDGHVALIRAARGEVGPAGHVTVTIFVNPLQFSAGEDFGTYPRTLGADLQVCAAEDVDLVFAPATDVMYPTGDPEVRVDPGPLGTVLEGAARPGHFSGVLTVVLKLLNLTKPDATFFGEKDFQQLALVRRMVRDLDLPVRVHGVPIVREADGLARSSRNRYLTAEERAQAAALPAALAAGVTAADLGRSVEAVVGAAEVELTRVGIAPEYVALTDPLLGPPPREGAARLLIAARVGATRLLDNTPITLRG
ncbi:MAG: pantoate--beta-alanine ligase [Candidatus Nanopelagicales bacterium]